jgi:hypothetical protein
MRTLIAKNQTATVYDNFDIPAITEFIEFTPAHGAQGALGGVSVCGMIGQTQIVSDLVQGHFQSPVNKQFIFHV